ncbi:MAG: SUF system NifU family Fe-S cluster assembly protein, partial [Deltaproteobacteria bacterium]|nr:SUF system NifU family Fe-S cluster assembly protein [Deltaproteobacteria bacterium]
VPKANAHSHGLNPLCGDDYELFVAITDDGMIKDIGFQGSGCAISKSSASLLTSIVKGKTVDEALRLAKDFHHLVTRDDVSPEQRAHIGRPAIFEGVKQYPVRVKCAMLIWRTLEDALQRRDRQQATVSTEEDH